MTDLSRESAVQTKRPAPDAEHGGQPQKRAAALGREQRSVQKLLPQQGGKREQAGKRSSGIGHSAIRENT